MAIEIILRPKIEKVSWANVIFTIILVLFLIFLLSYAILFFYHKKLKEESLELEKKLLERTQKEKELEEEILASKKLIEDWKLVAANHSLVSGVFELLEKNTHPQVWFSDFKLNLDQRAIEIKGRTDNFETLGQQLLIFEKQEFIKKIVLSNVSTDKEGKVIFDLQFDLDPKIFNPDLSQEKK